MKKGIVMMLVLAMIVSLAGCGRMGAGSSGGKKKSVKVIAKEDPVAEEALEESDAAEQTAEGETGDVQGEDTLGQNPEGALTAEEAKAAVDAVAKMCKDWAGLHYFYERGTVDSVTTEVAIQIAVDVVMNQIGPDHYEYDEETWGLLIPSDMLEKAEMDLFGQTYDSASFDAEKAENNMVFLTESGQVERNMGDWGLVFPAYDVASAEEMGDGTCVVTLQYYSYMSEANFSNYADGCFIRFLVEANPESSFGIRILDIDIDYELPFMVSSFLAEDEWMIPMYDVAVGEENNKPNMPVYVMMCSEKLEKVELCSLSMDYAEAEGFYGSETAVLDAQGPVEPREFFVVYPGDVGETIPLVGVRLTCENGDVHHYYLQISGKDGSAVVTEFQP